MSSSNVHGPVEIRAAATAVANVLMSSVPTYALVGGSACVVLGSDRATADIDFVVLRGQTAAARQLLRASPFFNVEPRTNHTTYNAGSTRVDIEILTPPTLFRERFDETTEVITVGNAKVLKPALLLNSKCRSIIGRANEAKKMTDSQDIIFLLGFCAQNPAFLPKATEVPNATLEFVQMFIQVYSHQDEWTRAGYGLCTGLFAEE
ncbi:hypothetical protein BJX99DRAFT_241062 [Aspergillus californicus]